MTPVWNGSMAERDELLRILSHHCTCQYDASGALTGLCAPHAALVSSQRFLDGLVFARRIATRLVSEESIADASELEATLHTATARLMGHLRPE